MYINDRGQKVFVGQEALALQPRVQYRRLLERIHYRTTFQKLPISVENRKGSVRSGVDQDGDEWRTKMKVPYGYIRGTEGKDGDHLDVFVGGNENAAFAYVVHCNTPDGKRHDEDKVMLGFSSAKAAKQCFLQHYDDPKFFGGIEHIPMWKFHDLAFVKKITTKKIKENREGASLQLPQEFFEDRIHNWDKAQAGRDTDQIMRKSILGHHQDIMTNPEVRESEEMGVKGMRWGTAGTKEQPARQAAMKHGYSEDDKTPGIFHKGSDTVVTHNDGRWSHTSLDKGTTKGEGGVDLHYHLSGQQESREGGPGSGRHREIIEKAGAEYGGQDSQLVHFHDPKTKATYSMKPEDVNEKSVAAKLEKGRAAFGDKPEEKMHPILQVMYKKKEAQEHGVKGMKWGVRKPRQADGKVAKGETPTQPEKAGKQAPIANKPSLANDPRTLSMMQVEKGQKQLQQVQQAQQQEKAQGKPSNPREDHEKALDALKELGWKIAEVGSKLTGTEGLLNAVKSVVRSPAGKRFAVTTDRAGNHKLESPKPTQKRTRTSRTFESRLGAFLREAKVYYARSLDDYGSKAEESDLADIEEAGDDAIVPATKNHAGLGMDYFHKKIDKADKVVVRASKGRKLTLGVFSEAKHALRKGKPVFAMHKGKMRRVKSVETLGKPDNTGHFGKLIFRKRKRA